jgi:hypothetical protein
MALQYSPKINTTGLVLYLNAGDVNSYPSSGAVWYDLMGNGNANQMGSPTHNPLTKSFTFDSSSDYFSLNENTTFSNLNGDVTLTGWFKQLDSVGPHQTIICTDISYRHGLKLMSYYHGGIAAWLGNSDGSQDYLLNSSGVAGTGWHFMATTRNKDSGVLTLYLDGVLVNNVTTFVGNTALTGTPAVGLDYHSSGYYYNGDIAMVQGYNRVLSSVEILELYKQHKRTFGL